MAGRKNTSLVLLIICSVCALAQRPAATFRADSNLVMVPTIVSTRSGEIVHGLSARDFVLEEDGVEQSIRLDDAPEQAPVSLVIAVQRGGGARMHFPSAENDAPCQFGNTCPPRRQPDRSALSGLSTMVEHFVGGLDAEVAVVAFDSQVELLQDFTSDVASTLDVLDSVRGSGNERAAVLDAVSYSLGLLESRARGRRRVLLLISQNCDSGSRTARFQSVLQQVTAGNVLVYTVAFSPVRTKLVRELKGQNADFPKGTEPALPGQHPSAPGPNLVQPLLQFAISLMARNTPRALSELSGGEYYSFSDKRSFDANLALLSNHLRSYYLLSFQPREPRPGPHSITVRLRSPRRDTIVRARMTYWVVESGGR